MWQPLGDRFHEKRRTRPEIPWTIAVGDPWRSRCRSQPLAIGMFLCDPSSKCQIASSLSPTSVLMDLAHVASSLQWCQLLAARRRNHLARVLAQHLVLLRVIAQPTVLGAPSRLQVSSSLDPDEHSVRVSLEDLVMALHWNHVHPLSAGAGCSRTSTYQHIHHTTVGSAPSGEHLILASRN